MPKPTQEWLVGKTADDLDLIEHGGRVYFHDVMHRIKRKAKEGKGAVFEPMPVVVCVPRAPERALARRDALELAREWKIDREKDADIFDTLDKFALVAHAVRTVEPPHGQFQPLRYLVSTKEGEGFDERALWAIWERIKLYEEMVDPRITEPMSEEDVIAACFAIAKVRNLSPLVAIAGSELDNCVISMASLVTRYRMQELSSPSSETSTAGA